MSQVTPTPETDDLATAVKENRPLRTGARYRVALGNEFLEFQDVILNDPLVLGRQLIESSGGHPVDEYTAIAMLQNGDFEDIRLDEPFDLRGKGTERVLVVRSDRSFRYTIDDRDLQWPYGCISGAVLFRLADLPENYNLWRDVRGGQDVKIRPTDLIRLDDAGVERFISLIDQTTEGLEQLPPDDRVYLSQSGMVFDVVVENGQTGIVLKDFPLPAGKFNHDCADVLVLLPSGYPDCAPDMFFTHPSLTLAATGRQANATNAQQGFGGRTWQRWSRHNTEWRAGIDGLRTSIARAITALEDAQ